MKTKLTFLMLLTALLALPPLRLSAAIDETGSIYYMRSSDGLDNEVLVDGKITFISQTGTTIPSYKDTGTNFKPANDGEVLKITVDAIDLAGTNYLLVYETPIEAVKSGVSDGVDQSRYLPAGWLYKLTAENVGFSYQSTAEDGGLSFGFHSNSPNSQKGFSITIESIALKDMEYAETTWTDNLAQPYRGQKDAAIAGVTIKMDGGLNPLTLNRLTLDCSALQSVSDKVSNIRLYKSKPFTDDNLVATLNGDLLTVSGMTLKSGANTFYVVGDLVPEATGDLADITISELTIDNTAYTPASSAVRATAIKNEIRIAATPTTYTIHDATDFYDDGGKDGKISSKFEGSVTFVPANPGNAIKVDVTKLAIFNTSSTGLNDVFNFYNGREATDENLIATLLKNPRFIKSTAADGSMTVTLKSTTGIPADGWEAVVTEYTPGNMTLGALNATPSEYEGTVSSMQTGVEMLKIYVNTDNNVNPLTLGVISLSTANPASFKAIDIYAVDNTSETPTHVKAATVNPTDAVFSVELNRSLVEGHNEFVVVADIADNLMSGDKVSLKLTSVSISGTNHDVDAAKELDVKNVWQSTEGTHTVSVNGEWGFTHTPNSNPSYADSKYEGGTVDQVTTFKPATPSMVMQLDFSTFDVYYSSGSWGVKSTFEVYNGSTCSDDALLWKVDDTGKAANGPGYTIRSSAADGALTIKFNPKETASYYCGKGWHATVKEFLNHDMKIAEATASLPTDAEMGVAAKEQSILDFALTTEGTLTVKELKKINLTVKNPQALAAIAVYTSSQADGSNPVLFGKNENPAATTSVEGTYRMLEGVNYFFVKIDVADDAQAETTVSAGLASVEDANSVVNTFDNCTPEGGRTVKDMLICAAGESTVTVSGNKMFYDDGGKDGKISSRIAATYTFVPSHEGYAVTIDSKMFSMGNGHIYIYSGRVANDKYLLGSATGFSATKGPSNLVSKADDGTMTLVITGPSGSTLDGFALELGLHERVPYSLESAEATAVPTTGSQVVRGSANVALLDVAANIAGDKDASVMSALKFSLDGTTNLSDVKALHLYYTATGASFSPNQATLLGTIEAPTTTEATFDATVTAGDCGSFHFFLTADLDNAATVGNAVKASFRSMAFNGETKTAAASSAAAEIALAQGMSGTFTIGSSSEADYATFKAATDALKTGIEGPVTLEIENGTYNENLVIENIAGTSAANQLVIRSKSGSRADVVINGKFSEADKNGIVQIVATPFVTVENLTVQAGSASFANAVYVGNGSYDATIRNLDVSADKVTSGYNGVNLLRTYSPTDVAGLFNDNLTVTDCHFAGGYIGLYLASNGLMAWPQDRNYRIVHNTFDGIGKKAVYACDIRDLQLCDNSIIEPTPSKSYYATDIYRVKGAIISGNRIVTGNDENQNDANNLYFRTGCCATETSPFRIFNNEVVIVGSPSYGCRAIQISNDCYGLEVAYNTFRANGSAVYLFATSGNFTAKDNKFVNNIFHTDCTESASYPVYFWNDTDINGYEFTGNVFYSANSSICKNDKDVLDAAGFDALTGNTTNLYEQAQFFSASDSHLAEAGNLNAGTPLEYVTVDREGTVRSAKHPTIGAFEYSVPSTDAPVLGEGYPQVGTPSDYTVAIITKWDMNGTLYAIAKEIPAESEVTAPTVDELLATAGTEIQADTENTRKFTGLTPETSYKAWFMATSGTGVQSEIVETEVFTTMRHIEPLEVAFADEPISVAYGTTATLEGGVSGGDEPYTYVWTSQTGEELATTATIDVTSTLPARYTLTVTSADGQTATAHVAVEPTGVPDETPLTIATFDDNLLESESHFTPVETGKFYSGSFAFNYGGMPAYDYWYGYTFSNETSTDYTGLADQFRNAAGGGLNSSNFCVGYPEGQTIEPVGFENGAVIPGFYVNNAASAYNSMANGDGFSEPFDQDDWFLLKARIVDENGATTDHDLIYLADMRDTDEAEHYILSDWEYVDLSHFGKIKSIAFILDSSDKSGIYLNTPAYLCIEDFGTLPHAEEMSLTVPEEGIDLGSLFTTDGSEARVEYTLVEQTSDTDACTVRLEDGKLFLDVDENTDASATALVSMHQKGHTQYLRLTLTREIEPDGIASATADGGNVKVTVNANSLNVITAMTGYSVNIYTVDGMHIYRNVALNGPLTISRDKLPAGVLIVSVKSQTAESTHRVLLK